MRKKFSNLGGGSAPFPSAKPTQALRAEDEFMKEHGRRGNRLVYLLVATLSEGIWLSWRDDAVRDEPAPRRAGAARGGL